MVTTYKDMCRATSDAKDCIRKNLQESCTEQMHKSESQRLLSSDYASSGYKTRKKPKFTKLNILGNMKKTQLTRAQSSGGPSMRPAIASATGGSHTVKAAANWPVT